MVAVNMVSHIQVAEAGKVRDRPKTSWMQIAMVGKEWFIHSYSHLFNCCLPGEQCQP